MPLALIIEDGTGKADANAFASFESVSSYAQWRGGQIKAAWDKLDEQGQIAVIIDFTQLLQHVEWEGRRTYSERQALAFPRTGLYHRDTGLVVAQDEIPSFLIEATGEGAPWLSTHRDHRLTLEEDRRTSSSSVAGRSRSFFQAPRLELFPPSVLQKIAPYAQNAAGGSSVTMARKLRVA